MCGGIGQHELLEKDVEKPTMFTHRWAVHGVVEPGIGIAGKGFVLDVDATDIVVARAQPAAQLVGPVHTLIDLAKLVIQRERILDATADDAENEFLRSRHSVFSARAADAELLLLAHQVVSVFGEVGQHGASDRIVDPIDIHH